MHGYIASFLVEHDSAHVIMTVHDPAEDQNVTVRVSKAELAAMADAQPFWSNGAPPQTPTPSRKNL